MTREQYELKRAIERRRAYLEAVQPFVKMKVNLYALALPKWTIYPDGRIEMKWPQWVLEQAAMIDTQIGYIAESSRGDNDA